jgi:FMN phosphatase YigB (HAD superfamily)
VDRGSVIIRAMTAIHPTSILVDLDNTLHDYNGAGRIARDHLAQRVAGITGLPLETVRAAYQELITQDEEIAASGMEARRRRLQRLGETLRVCLPVDDLVTTFGQALVDAVSPFPGAIRALEEISARYRVIIMTEGYFDIQQAIAMKLGLGQAQWPIFVTYAHGVRKRDGTAYAKALKEYGLHAAGTVMVGDNWDWDIASASAQGLAQVWVSNGRAMPAPAPPRFLGSAPDFRAVPPLLGRTA